MHRLRVVLISMTLCLPSGWLDARAGEPGYVTLAFGRMQWVTTNGSCVPLTNAVPLSTIVDAMVARDLSGTGIVIVDRIEESTRMCFGRYTLQASWTDLASLRDDHGWTFVSGGTHRYMPDLDHEEKVEESCGSLPVLEEHGHLRGWGLFAYANNRFDDASQDVVNDCFAFGRTYQTRISNVLEEMAPPWYQSTHSLNGGRCNVPSLPCYTIETSFDTRYEIPSRFASFLSPASGEWSVLQAYRFVRGARLSGAMRWDCRSSDPRRHWTTKAELYCYQDYVRILDLIGGESTVTDPTTVAETIGRVP